MSDSNSHNHHRIDYIEFSVTNMTEAKSFYSQVFGWEFTDYAPGYSGIKGDTKEVGGLALCEKVETGGPLVVLYSNDLEDTLKKVRSFKAEIVKEIFDFPGGRRFEFLDPSGNLLAVWSLT